MKQLKLIVGIILVGIAVALTYHVFEGAVHGSINAIWYTWLDTSVTRWLVVPTCLVLTTAYFGAQHYLDRGAETKHEHGLGEVPEASVKNYLKILGIGFLSLVAGASLGPEAVLVPACMVAGAYLGGKLFKNDKQLVGLMAAAGLMALFTAFFGSIVVGVLSLALVLKQAKTKFKPMLLVVAVLASTASWLTLQLVDAKAYVALPVYNWKISETTILWSGILVMAGYLAIVLMSQSSKVITKLTKWLTRQSWLWRAAVAGLVLSLLYLLGGPLVEFTGNKSIIPLFEQAGSLGVMGLAWILIIKIAAISWSKSIGYRGGMIFPTIFVAAVLVAMVQQTAPQYNLVYGLIAVLIGAFAANSRNGILV